MQSVCVHISILYIYIYACGVLCVHMCVQMCVCVGVWVLHHVCKGYDISPGCMVWNHASNMWVFSVEVLGDGCGEISFVSRQCPSGFALSDVVR